MGSRCLSTRKVTLLDSFFQFRERAPLKLFVQEALDSTDVSFTFRRILEALKEFIASRRLYDETNPSMIICSDALEAVLDRKALHVSQVRAVIMAQLSPLSPDHGLELEATSPPAGAKVVLSSDPCLRYELKPALRRVFGGMETFDPAQTSFFYCEITALLSVYILQNKHELIDKRNVYVLLLNDDPLSEAFQVKSFHRSQVHALLRAALILVSPPIISSDCDHDLEAGMLLFQNLTFTDTPETASQ